MKNSVECSVLVDVKSLLVAQLINTDGFSWIEAESLSQLLHFIIEKIDLFFTAIDALCIFLNFPDKCIQRISILHHCKPSHSCSNSVNLTMHADFVLQLNNEGLSAAKDNIISSTAKQGSDK